MWQLDKDIEIIFVRFVWSLEEKKRSFTLIIRNFINGGFRTHTPIPPPSPMLLRCISENKKNARETHSNIFLYLNKMIHIVDLYFVYYEIIKNLKTENIS